MKQMTLFMGKLYSISTLFILVPFLVMAQELPPVLTEEEISNQDFLEFLLQSLNGVQGLTAMGIAALVTQIIVGALKTPLVGGYFQKLAGRFKLLIVSGISLASGIISLKVAGLDWTVIFVHSFVLTAAQVFAHQAFLQFVKKPE